MSLRKITTLILLAAFALTQVPVQAATLTSSVTKPNVIVDAGTAANGANRDVVPVTLAIDTLSTGEVFFGTYSGNGTFAVTENGQLTTGGAIISGSTKVTVIQPPTGAEFVGLAGYNSNVTTALLNPTTTATQTLVNVTATNLPAETNRDTAILAKIITQDGPASTFGSVIPKGSIVVYTITNATSNTTTGESDITFNNIGLAVPAGSTLTSFNATYKEVIIGPTITNEAVPSLVDGAPISIANLGTAGTSQIAAALASEPDAQSNSVLADLIAKSSSTVKVSTNYVTTTTTNAAILYVDTDALLIQAAEVTTGVFYDTPFNTSSFLSAVANGNSTTVLNAALNSTSFPNAANALISVAYSLVPLTGNGTTDATLVVDAASVSLEDSTGASGFLGALAVTPTINGTGAITAGNYAVSVLYNGISATGALPVVDFDSLDDAQTDVTALAARVGFSFTAPADPIARTSATGTPFNVANGTLQTGIFPGVTVAQADALGTTPGVVQTAGALTPFTVVATGFAGATAGEPIWVPNEVTARLLPTGGNAVFAFTGNNAAAALTKAETKVGPTNLATVPYGTAAFVQNNAADDDVKNNGILVARLAGNTVQIMPLVNKVDSVRDVIKVRPEATITLGANSKAQGVRLIATITGNNIVGSRVVEIARINAAGSTNANISVSSVPAAGTLNRLLAENGTSASTLRVALNLSSVNNLPATDELKDLIANGSVLDNTLPSFFCGGIAGTVTKGPNSVPQQPYARAILLQEAAVGEFAAARVGGGNDRIRFTLPVGVDLVKTDATAANNDVNVIATDSAAVGTFAATPVVTAYRTISENNGAQAFIDVNLPATVPGTTTVKNAIALIFGQYSLVIPQGQTNFDATVTLVNDDGTTSTAADIVLDTLGTAPLATGCAQQFTISYCDDALSNFGQGDGPVVSNIIANGSLLTGFSNDVSSAVRLLNTSTTAFRIPDICVTEAVADALFVAPSATTPNIFGPGQNISLALSDVSDLADNTDDIGFASAGTIDTSDDSISFSAPFLAGNLLNSVTNAGTGTDSFLESTTIRYTGITLNKTGGNFQPSLQNITVFTNDGASHIATSMPAAFETRGANGTALSTRLGTGVEEEVINTFFNGDNIANNTAAIDALSGNFSNGRFLGFAFAGNSPKLTNAVKTTNDSASAYSLFSDTTKLSIAVDDIAAVTNGLAAYTRITVFTSGGDLEPGSIITITSPTDSVSVPVMDDGNFIAQLRGAEGDTLVLVQTPTSTQTTADQTVVVEAQDQNLEPTLLSAVAQNFTSIGTVTEQGTAPVLFKLTSVGRVGSDVFIPTASQLTVGGSPVYAVPGTDDMFLAIIDFKKTNGTTVTANVTGSPSVGITGLDSDFPTFAKSSRPTLVKVQQKTRKDGDTRLIFRGSKLRNSGVGYIVTSTGSVQEVTFRNRTSSDRQASRVVSQGTATIPANALFGVYHVRGRGISTIDISN